MNQGDAALTVQDERTASRYVARLGAEQAAVLEYRLYPGAIALIHAETDDRFGGRGIASRLVREALQDAREHRLSVLPFCPFVSGYIKRHREFLDLVAPDERDRFGL